MEFMYEGVRINLMFAQLPIMEVILRGPYCVV